MYNKFLFPFLLLFAVAAVDGYAATAVNGECGRYLGEAGMGAMPEVRIALVQFNLELNKTYDEFWRRYSAEVAKAKNSGADLVVFPELVIYDLVDSEAEQDERARQFRQIALEVAPRFFADVRALAKSQQISILSGSTPILEQNNIYNRVGLFFANGTAAFQDKNFLTVEERDYGWQGARSGIQTFATPWGPTSIAICYDCEFPQHSVQLAKDAPELILVPSMTSDKHGRNRVLWSAMARAIEHHAFVAVTGTAGEAGDFFGQTNIVEPQDGDFSEGIISGAENQHGQLLYTLDLRKLRLSRKQATIYPSRDFQAR